jgi:hypothetical protein
VEQRKQAVQADVGVECRQEKCPTDDNPFIRQIIGESVTRFTKKNTSPDRFIGTIVR